MRAPGRYAKVGRRVWTDAAFRELSAAPPNGQTLWLRFLTGPELTNIPGLIPAWEAGLAQSLGWDLEGFREAFAEVFAQGLAKADWRAGLVWVPKAIYYNAPESPNVVRGWRPVWNDLPECPLKEESYQSLKAFVEGLGEGFAKAFAEGLAKGMPNQDQDQDQDQDQEQEQNGDLLTTFAGAVGPTDGDAMPSENRDAAKRVAGQRRPARGPRGSRMQPGWKPSDATLQWAAGLGVRAEACVDEFVDHWVSVPGERGVKVDWEATFRNRIRALIDSGRAPSGGGSVSREPMIEIQLGVRGRRDDAGVWHAIE